MNEDNRFTSRKLIVIAIAFITGIVMSYFGKLDKVTADFIVYMCGAYIVGNVGEKIKDVFTKKEG